MFWDLRALQNEVVDTRTRPLVVDVVKAYEAGALRAATVSLWIAVVADLTYKIRYLAESGDGRARVAIEGLDRAVSNGEIRKIQQYENSILDLASNDLEIISSREKEELSRLNVDRNSCAHPGFLSESELFLPDAELVLSHIVAASRSVFTQRPLSGKRLLNVLDKELSEDSWPAGNSSELKKYLLERYFDRTRDSVRDNLIRVLIKNAIRPKEDDGRRSKRCSDAVNLIADEYPESFERLMTSVLKSWEEGGSLSDKDLVRAVGAYGQFSVFWRAIPSTAKTRLMAVLEQNDTVLINDLLFVSGIPKDEEVAKKVRGLTFRLNREELEIAIRQAREASIFVPAAIKLVGESKSFRGAEANLRVLELCSRSLASGDVANLTQAIVHNEYDQVRLAGDTEAILISIYADSPLSTEHSREWQKLAEKLYVLGKENDNNYYRYENLCREVGVDFNNI